MTQGRSLSVQLTSYLHSRAAAVRGGGPAALIAAKARQRPFLHEAGEGRC